MTIPGEFDDFSMILYKRLAEFVEEPIKTPEDLSHLCAAYAILCHIRKPEQETQ